MSVMQDDMTDLMTALGISTNARPVSPHEVMQNEIIPAVRALRAPGDRLEQQYHRENRELRERVAELEMERQNFRRAWKTLAVLADVPRLLS